MRATTFLLLFTTVLFHCKGGQTIAGKEGPPVVSTEDVVWEDLNPARGDKSPRAGALWGSRTGPGPAGFLLKPAPGFKSPPHFHSARYQGVVITGGIHNDKPEKKEVYLGPGGFWIQPAGGIHITASQGESLAYIEVEDAFDVRPVAEAPQIDEKNINIPAKEIRWQKQKDGTAVAQLWGTSQGATAAGRLLKVPAGSAVKFVSEDGFVRSIVIKGKINTGGKSLGPGGYFATFTGASKSLDCRKGQDCVFYQRTQGKFSVSLPGNK